MGNVWFIVSIIGMILSVALLIMSLKSGLTDVGKNKSMIIIICMIIFMLLFSMQIFTYGQQIIDITNEEQSWSSILSEASKMEYRNKKMQSNFMCVEGLVGVIVLFLSGQQILYTIKLRCREQSMLKSKSTWKLKELAKGLTNRDELLKKARS